MITVLNPDYKYKETRKPNKSKPEGLKNFHGFARNPITGWSPSGWAPSPTYTNNSSVSYAANDGYKPNRG